MGEKKRIIKNDSVRFNGVQMASVERAHAVRGTRREPGPHAGRRLQANGKTTKGSANARERSSVRPRLLPIFTS